MPRLTGHHASPTSESPSWETQSHMESPEKRISPTTPADCFASPMAVQLGRTVGQGDCFTSVHWRSTLQLNLQTHRLTSEESQRVIATRLSASLLVHSLNQSTQWTPATFDFHLWATINHCLFTHNHHNQAFFWISLVDQPKTPACYPLVEHW